ncbi:hypothetical protein [Nostoc sp. UHCC 0251]|nr:hypothetical protein [Nostoc sp. UHCC 0251]MEA5625663.1 hypothetical protein [Nostoc sp. UHCC 0251]
MSAVVPLPYGTLRERGSKLRVASRREGSKVTHDLILGFLAVMKW